MLSALGPRRFDVTLRPVVLGRVAVPGPAGGRSGEVADIAGEHADAGADGLLLDPADAPIADSVGSVVAEAARAAGLPVVVRTSDARVLQEALAGGASGGHDPSGLRDPEYLPAVATASATLVVGVPAAPPIDPVERAGRLIRLAEAAREAGVAPERIVIDVARRPAGDPMAAVGLLRELPIVARAGWVAAASLEAAGSGPDTSTLESAAHAVAVPRGARLVVTSDVRSTRRAVAVVGELLDARRRAGIST